MSAEPELPGADGQDFRAIYRGLRELAARELRRDRNPRALDPTDLVHECYVRLARVDGIRDMSRARFHALAAKAFRHVLVDEAREHGADKRGRGRERVTLREGDLTDDGAEVDLVDLDAALTELAELDPRQARIVELRYFGGLTGDEVAEVLGVTRRTVTTDWAMARAWLRRRLE